MQQYGIYFLFPADAKVQRQEVVPVLMAGVTKEAALGLLGASRLDRDFHCEWEQFKESDIGAQDWLAAHGTVTLLKDEDG